MTPLDSEDWRCRNRRAALKRILTFGLSRGFTEEDVEDARELVDLARAVGGENLFEETRLDFHARGLYIAVKNGKCWFDVNYHAPRLEEAFQRRKSSLPSMEVEP